MKPSPFSIKSRLRSFIHAFNGLGVLFKEEHNSRIHLLAAILVIGFGFYFHISSLEWISIIVVITLVFVTEIFNSTIERIADFIQPEKDDKIKKIKDLSAAAVLLSAILAVIIACIVFIPKIPDLF